MHAHFPTPSPGPGQSIGRPVSAIPRARAIAEGALIDVTDTAVQAGFTLPVALTRGAWDDCVAWSDEDTRCQVPQDAAGRLWDVVWMLRVAIGKPRQVPARVLWFQLMRVPRDGRSDKPRPTILRAEIGAGDGGEAVMTLMRP